MEHGFRPLKAGKMHPNTLKTLPSGAARQGGHRNPQALLKRCTCERQKAQQCSPLLVGWGLILQMARCRTLAQLKHHWLQL